MSHHFDLRVYYEDTDAGGIVYHSNYLNFAERARSEMVRELGIVQSALLADGEGRAFAVRHADVEFLKPARLDDMLRVVSEVTEVGGATLQVRQVIRRLDDGAELVRLKVRLGFISLKGRPARMPADMRALFAIETTERR
jgi:acyl-CoA thioester hydrolase